MLSPDFENGGTGVCSGMETNLVRTIAAGGPVDSNGYSQVVYAGTTNGHLWFTTTADSGDASWQGWILSDPFSTGGSGYPISDIAMDPAEISRQMAL